MSLKLMMVYRMHSVLGKVLFLKKGSCDIVISCWLCGTQFMFKIVIYVTHCVHAGLIYGRSGRDTLEDSFDSFSNYFSGARCRISISVVWIYFRTSV